MKKLLSTILTSIILLATLNFVGCTLPSGPVYSDTYVSNATHHWRPLIDGGENDPLYVDYGAHVNKKGRCDCGYYYPCTSLMYTLNGARTGLICHGAVDIDSFASDTSGVYNLSDFDYGGYRHVEVPEEAVYEGVTYPVVEIANYAFAYEKIETIKLHEGLTKLGSYAFAYTTNLKEVVIPNSVIHNAKYGYWFNNATGIEKVVFGNGITFIPSYCFYGALNLKNIVLGNAVTNVGISAFWGCDKLEYIVLPETFEHFDTDPRSNGLNNDNVYPPFGGMLPTFAMYWERATLPSSLDPAWNPSGYKCYMKGQWAYDSNGKPYPL